MEETSLSLSKPIEANNMTISELKFDWDKMTGADYKNISRVARMLSDNPVDVTLRETSSEFRIATAWVCACKTNVGLMDDMILKLSIKDILGLEEIGVFFIAGV